MSERKNIVILTGFILSVSLIAASFTAFFLTNSHNRTHIRVLGEICQKIIENQPEAELAVLSALKEYEFDPKTQANENIILSYGYSQTDFLQSAEKYSRLYVIVGFLTGSAILLFTLLFCHKKNTARIKNLTEYLEKAGTQKSVDLFQVGEDDFSKLQDEIYKTVTKLYQTRDAALAAKRNFADNLYNIAHQIKTPITSISLSIQMMQEDPTQNHLEQIQNQLVRLTHLEEALLLLSRIDAGTLSMEKKAVDVFTVLTLAADNLQELLSKANVSVQIPESDPIVIYADLDWTMEALMNLMKNCMEHTPSGGTVYSSYEQNPLYTRIRIWDTGSGFAKEDIPHLFKRFYRGKKAGSGGIGIGLSLSKAIIESQNGTISACNLPDGGACFEIHMYSH